VFSVAKTERATRPSSPFRLSLGSWRSAFKGAGKEFIEDDCLGLAQQVAFSSLLAFFPSVILVVGLLGLLGSGAYDSLINLLGTVAPKGVLSALELAKKSSADNHAGSAIALTIVSRTASCPAVYGTANRGSAAEWNSARWNPMTTQVTGLSRYTFHTIGHFSTMLAWAVLAV